MDLTYSPTYFGASLPYFSSSLIIAEPTIAPSEVVRHGYIVKRTLQKEVRLVFQARKGAVEVRYAYKGGVVGKGRESRALDFFSAFNFDFHTGSFRKLILLNVTTSLYIRFALIS